MNVTSPIYIGSYLSSVRRKYESWQDKGYESLHRWNLDNSIVVHPQLSHRRFQRDDALMGVRSNILLLGNFNFNPILLQHL